MKYHQFDHMEQVEGDFYRKITEIVAQHLGIEGDDAAFFGERLISHAFLNPYQVFDRSKDIRALQRLSRALREISLAMSDVSLSPLAAMRLDQSLLFGEFFENMMANKATFNGDDFGHYLENTGRKDLEALTRIEAEAFRIRAGVEQTIKHIDRSPLTKVSASKFNADAVGVVSACRLIWGLARGKEAPTTLNPASPFAYFLSDILEAGSIKADPVAAVKAWKKETQKVYTSEAKNRPKCR